MAKSPVAILYTLDDDGEAVPLAIADQGVQILMVHDQDTNKLLKEMVDELKAVRELLSEMADEGGQ